MTDNYAAYLFHQGTHYRAWHYLGCHKTEEGFVFRVWAPNAKAVSLVGDFNGWQQDANPMERLTPGGVWACICQKAKQLDAYKYAVTGPDGDVTLKADPFAVHSEERPGTASKVYELSDYKWKDRKWMQKRATTDPAHRPMNIYEAHLGSWRKYADGSCFDYEKAGQELADYAVEMGYTHIELMPLSEYPYDKSWGYQVTGYFSPTARYGLPEGLMRFVDICHQKGIGVIMDWVPAHFPRDAFGLAKFDGTPTFEYADPRKGEHPDWGTLVFDFGRPEVQSFLISSACNWIETYHFDGIRVDAVASMLYLDYGRKDGQWVANDEGGNQNKEAIRFLQNFNKEVHASYPGVITVAEESTAWPMVTTPVADGGLGFTFKWNMGWMNDTTRYLATDPFFRNHNQNQITFSLTYAHSESFILPLSHDEVVHGKCSLVNKCPGDYPTKFANLRCYLGYMYGHMGKKLLFMGGELAQFIEWNEEREIDWLLLDYPAHQQFHQFVKQMNKAYLANPALWQEDRCAPGFEWISGDDTQNSVLAFLRHGEGEVMLCVSHFGSQPLTGYCLGVPRQGRWAPVLDTDSVEFGGEAEGATALKTTKTPLHGKPWSVKLDLPPFTTRWYRWRPTKSSTK